MSTAQQPSRAVHLQTASALDQSIAATSARAQSTRTRAAAFLGCDPSKIADVLRGVWTTTKGNPPLTDQELIVGMALIARYDLDPFAREIYVTRGKKGLMVILGVDGWVRVLDRTDHYDGFTQDLVLDDDGNITEVTTTIYSKKRSHPAVYRAFASEYAKLGGFVAGLVPGHMLRIFSLKHAARLFIPLGGAVTEEEATWMGSTQPEAPPVSSLDELTEKLNEKPDVDPDESLNQPTPEVDSPLNPPTPEEVAADQERISNEYSGMLSGAADIEAVSAIRSDIVRAVTKKELSSDLAGQLYELANGADERIRIVKL